MVERWLGPSTRRGGRIYGIWSPERGAWSATDPKCAGHLRAMDRALGRNAEALRTCGLVADADACWLEGKPVSDFAGALDRLPQLLGAFALAWLSPDGALHLASDPVGHRSLYHAPIPGGGIVFASSIDGVLASGLVPLALDARAVPIYLAFAYVPGPRTLIEHVQVLPAGHELVLNRAGSRSTCYAPLPFASTEHASDDERRRALRRELEGAVARALPPSLEPLGATLSGGIDSSLVLALARRLYSGRMHAYSVSFGAGNPSELEWSGLVARHLGIEQQVVEVTPELVQSELDSTIAALSEPNGDPLTVPNTLLFRRAAADTCVVLNGEGGDPCFGGPKNAPMLLAELLGDGSSLAPDRQARARWYLRAHQKCYDELPELLTPALRRELALGSLEQLVMPWLEDASRPSLLDRLLALNIAFKGAHHILPKVASLSFSQGVCPRSPLFDFGLVQHSFSIPAHLKRAGAVEKYLLKEAARDLLPAAVIERPKSGMLVPVEAWFKGPLLPFARERLLDGLACYGLCERSWLEALLDARSSSLRPRRGVKLWLLLTLESWLRQKLGGKT